jgi:PAS domain S-box-containing protein
MGQDSNETPEERAGAADPTAGDRREPVTERHRVTLDIPADRPSPAGPVVSTTVTAPQAGQWAEPQLSVLIEQIEDYAVFVLDGGGNIRTWNDGAEAITGYTDREVLGEHVSTLYREDDPEAGRPDRILRAADGGVTETGWCEHADGSTFRARTTVRPLQERGENSPAS